MDAGHVDERRSTDHLRADQWPERASAVGADDVARPHLPCAPGIALQHRRGHPGLVLVDPRQFLSEQNAARIAGVGVALEQRLEVQLGHVSAGFGGSRRILLLQRAAAPGIDAVKHLTVPRGVAAKARIPGCRAQIGRRRALLQNLVGYSGLAEYFHRTGVEDMRLGQRRGHRMPFDKHRIDPEIREQQRRGQPAAATAHDQHIDVRWFILCHLHRFSLAGVRRSCSRRRH